VTNKKRLLEGYGAGTAFVSLGRGLHGVFDQVDQIRSGRVLSSREEQTGAPIMSNNRARTAILALAVLSVTAARPASAQTFQERWSPIPKANAAENPPHDQDQTIQGNNRQERPQKRGATPPDRSRSHARVSKQQPSAPVAQQMAHPRSAIVGKASFYAYAGGKTASGRLFHRAELTAASRTLPFGTRLRVTDLKTKKSVEVTVTDRGPASRHLMLDLSLGAAQHLGIASRGIIQVRAEIIS
jgi:peptidoglycan lytic transglycosylase